MIHHSWRSAEVERQEIEIGRLSDEIRIWARPLVHARGRLVQDQGDATGSPVRHRLSRGGNRRVNAVLYRIAMIQLRHEPRAREFYDNVRRAGLIRREAMRILKRQL